MSDPTPSLTVPAADWYPDRNDPRVLRWWDGQQWTDHTREIATTATGEAVVEPVSIAAFALAPATPAIPAGWYADNRDPALRRWWDGAQWTTHTAPVAPTAPAAGVATRPAAASAYAPSPTYALAATATPARAGGAGSNAAQLARGSFIVGLVSILINPLLAGSISAIVLGAVALRRGRGQAPAVARRGLAIAGIAIASAVIVIDVVAAVVLIESRSFALPARYQPSAAQPVDTGAGTGSQSGSGTATDFSPPTSTDELKLRITGALEKDGYPIAHIDCPADASVSPGSAYDCVAVLDDGRTTTVDVEFNADGQGFGFGYGPPGSTTGG